MKKLNCLLLAGMFFVLPLFMGAFDKDKPSASTSLRASNPEILANWSQLQTAIDNEHIFTGTAAGTQTGDHTQGSARCFSQADFPPTRIDGNVFLSTDLGSLWIDTDDNAMYILTATVPTWTPISTEVIATLLAANRVFAGTLGVDGNFTVNSNFDVTASNGNTVVAGTLAAQTSLDINSTVVVVGTIDDDTMAAATDTTISTAESIVAYADAAPAAQMTPTTESDATSSTGVTVFPNGFRIARGQESVGANAEDIVTPSGFTKIYTAVLTLIEDTTTDRPNVLKIGNVNDTTFTIRNTTANVRLVSWICIGR